MAKTTIDWDEIWEKFDEWNEDSDDPSWENQKRRIEYLVEEYLLVNYGL